MREQPVRDWRDAHRKIRSGFVPKDEIECTVADYADIIVVDDGGCCGVDCRKRHSTDGYPKNTPNSISIPHPTQPTHTPHSLLQDDQCRDLTFLQDPPPFNSADTTICCGPQSLCSSRVRISAINKLLDIAYHDGESRRIVRLGIPLTASEFLDTVFETITVALVAQATGGGREMHRE